MIFQMRSWVPVILVGLVVAACGGDDRNASTTPSTVSASAASTEPVDRSTIAATTATTRPRVNPTDRSFELDRSILSLALETGETGAGRFQLQRGRNSETLMNLEGRYWVNDWGNVYTALDIDPAMVAEQVAILVVAAEAMGGPPAGSAYLTSLREHYRGDEFQIGLTDLVRSLAVGGLPAEWAEQWSWFIQAERNPVPSELVACNDAIASLDQAALRWVRDLEIEFADGTWAFPTEDLEGALADEVDEASVCEEFVDLPGTSAEIVIRLSGEPNLRRVEVLVDDKIYTDQEPELMFAVVMWSDESVGPPPEDPNPASLLTLRGSYLTAIGVCGELPWIYSTFAAANTYYGPESDDYPGPVVFTSGWYCRDDVPEDRRREGG